MINEPIKDVEQFLVIGIDGKGVLEMKESNSAEYYIIEDDDGLGETADGPFTLAEAESLLEGGEIIISAEELALMQRHLPPDNEATSDLDFSMWSVHQKMIKDIRNWGLFMLLIGVVQMISFGFLSNTWGLLLIGVGLASFYFRSVAMFAIYGTTLGWAAISNFLSGSGAWSLFSVLQVVFAFQTFRQFFQLRKTLRWANSHEDELQGEDFSVDKAARPFPWLSFLFGGVSIFGFVIVFLGVIIFTGVSGGTELPSFIGFAEGLVIDLAVLGLAIGLASILLNYKNKALSIIGMIGGALVLLIEVGFNFLL